MCVAQEVEWWVEGCAYSQIWIEAHAVVAWQPKDSFDRLTIDIYGRGSAHACIRFRSSPIDRFGQAALGSEPSQPSPHRSATLILCMHATPALFAGRPAHRPQASFAFELLTFLIVIVLMEPTPTQTRIDRVKKCQAGQMVSVIVGMLPKRHVRVLFIIWFKINLVDPPSINSMARRPIQLANRDFHEFFSQSRKRLTRLSIKQRKSSIQCSLATSQGVKKIYTKAHISMSSKRTTINKYFVNVAQKLPRNDVNIFPGHYSINNHS